MTENTSPDSRAAIAYTLGLMAHGVTLNQALKIESVEAENGVMYLRGASGQRYKVTMEVCDEW